MNTQPYQNKPSRRLVRDLPTAVQPQHRLEHLGARALSDAELLAVALQAPDGLDLATDLLQHCNGLSTITRYSRQELMALDGIGRGRAAQLVAIVEIGRRYMAQHGPGDAARITSPADAANLLIPRLCDLAQEHLEVILLDTRNKVIGIETVYIGSLNTSVVRIGEVVRRAVVANAAAFIVAHNHPSRDPSPSPEDINVTRQIVKAGKLLDISLLDHIIIGGNRWVSLKEKGLGFDE